MTLFLETLPATECPPSNTLIKEEFSGYRLVASQQPAISDFYSKAALNEPSRPDEDECRWASCSLFPTRNDVDLKLKAIKSLKRRYKFAVKLDVPVNSGHAYFTTGHIDFWMFKTFDPIAAVVATEAL